MTNTEDTGCESRITSHETRVFSMSSLAEKFGVRYKKNNIIFCEYEKGDKIFILQRGKVKVTKIQFCQKKTRNRILVVVRRMQTKPL